MDEKNNLDKKRKFTTPDQIKFTKKISVQALPKTNSPFAFNQIKPHHTARPAISENTVVEKISIKSTEDKFIIKEEPIIKSIKFKEHEPNITDKIVADKEFDFIYEFQQLIEKRGSTLSTSLCEKFISEMLNSFKKPLKNEDLEYAADCFVRIEKSKLYF
ncbi:MAG: hypothetical protein ACFFAH_12170 [Promethearchaeota archaeon]